METILAALADEQSNFGDAVGNVTIVLSTGDMVKGILEGVDDDIVSIRRDLDLNNPGESYAGIPRHYAISAVIGAYYAKGS